MTDVLMSPFGHRTLDLKPFRGKGLRDPGIPKINFPSDRLGKHLEKPINRRASGKVMLLGDISPRCKLEITQATAPRMIGSFIRYNERKLREPER